MDLSTNNQIVCLIYIQRFQSETTFSAYDRLTPDEPSRV
jgi:hypothetical protein